MSFLRILRYWAPPLVWMAVIFLFSTDAFSGKETSGMFGRILGLIGLEIEASRLALLNFIIRKFAHFAGYAVLSLLWWRAFRGGRRQVWRWNWAAAALLLSSVWALLDEVHQSFTQTRTGSIWDCMIDVSGSFAALLCVWISARFRRAQPEGTARET
ncbi:MAG: VanZ family protein [Acidobacteria bacterium]|nr:VanZ family protein [Acidobacteriota bacterium]